MTESDTANASGIWSVPQCPFGIEYSLRVLDDIRLAVIDAFFSLPRGGAEIGGILLGSFANARLTISEYVALDCEHAFGPSFNLSPRDEAKLRELVDSAKSSGAVPVGWYHSHTRSEICLSEADVAIHNRFFPEPWQVALVMKPHTFQPTRCGFFFREAHGAIHTASSYQEFKLDSLPIRPVPAGEAAPVADAVNSSASGNSSIFPFRAASTESIDLGGTPPGAAGMIIDVSAGHEQVTAAESLPPPAKPEAAIPPRPVEPPRFAEPATESSWRWLKVVLATGVGIALGAAGYQTRELWWPKLTGLFTGTAAEVSFAPIGLTTSDTEGLLQIHWDRNSPTVRQAASGKLIITDGGAVAREIQLDHARLQSDNVSYARDGESVTVVLTLNEPNGRQAHEVSSFIGKLPQRSSPADDQEIRKQRDALTQESARLKQELAAEADRNRRLQKALEEAQEQLKQQVRKRLSNQIPK